MFQRPMATVITILVILGTAVLLVNPRLVYAQSGLRQAGYNWPAEQRVSIDSINHQSFDTLLKKYVDADGMVNYRAWHGSSDDRKALQNYIASLSRADHSQRSNRKAQLAYWINAYNAVTLEGILAVYPTDSIRNHTSKLGYNVWDDLQFLTGNKQLSLNDIEHKVLRKMNEPRIHFAIVCASIGCPRLLNEAYTANQLEKQLVTNSKDFFSRERNLQFDVANNRLKLSSIMKWFGSDFGDGQAAQVNAISTYLPDRVRSAVAANQVSVGYLEYDWNLNSQ